MSANPTPNGKESTERPTREPGWHFRGHELTGAEFTTAIVHFYRGEIQRANTWRNRLDATTNWAIVTTGAALSFALSSPNNPHAVLLIVMLLVSIFLGIEARRYRYFELFSYRVRLIETDFFAAMLVPPFQPSPDWAETLATSLLRPRFPISTLEAVGRRLRRNYLAILGVLLIVWLFKLYSQPFPADTFGLFLTRASIGPLAGEIVFGVVMAVVILLVVVAAITQSLQDSTGEILAQHRVFERLGVSHFMRHSANDRVYHGEQIWQRPHSHRDEFMVMIITDKGAAVAERIMQDLNRGVTALRGESIYNEKAREVLICALTETEIDDVKRAVNAADPEGFVAAMAANQVSGQGFAPLNKQ